MSNYKIEFFSYITRTGHTLRKETWYRISNPDIEKKFQSDIKYVSFWDIIRSSYIIEFNIEFYMTSTQLSKLDWTRRKSSLIKVL
jgi:hypothetical protein